MSKKWPGGRPKSDTPLVKRLSIRVSESEYEEFKTRAENAGLSTSEAIRLTVFATRFPKKVFGGLDVTASAAYRNLQPLQSNLNQIAHHLNSSRADVVDGVNIKDLALLCVATEQHVIQLRNEIILAAPRDETPRPATKSSHEPAAEIFLESSL